MVEYEDALEMLVIIIIGTVVLTVMLGQGIGYQKAERVIGSAFVESVDFHNILNSDCLSVEDSKGFDQKFLLSKNKIEKVQEEGIVYVKECFSPRGRINYRITIDILDTYEIFIFGNLDELSLGMIKFDKEFVNFVGVLDEDDGLIYPAIAKLEFKEESN